MLQALIHIVTIYETMKLSTTKFLTRIISNVKISQPAVCFI